MSPSTDPGGRDAEHVRHTQARTELASLALGERVEASVSAHVETCAECQQELAELTGIVELARGGVADEPASEPPAHVWDAIAEQAGVSPEPGRPERPASASEHRSFRGRVLLAAAAVVIAAAAAIGGWLVGSSGDQNSPPSVGAAALAAQPGVRDEAHGTARLHEAAGGYQLDVRARGLPAHKGYYEVWLYNPRANRMVAIGTLGTGGRGSFTVPGGIDLRAYYVVDVSAQRYNGNPAHDRSVLRGALPLR